MSEVDTGVGNQSEMAGAAFGRGMAATIMSFFGFVWLGWGFSAVAAVSNFPPALWAAFFIVTAVLMGFAIAALRRGRALMKAQGTSRQEFWSQRRRPFRIVTSLEVLGCVLVVVLANIFHRPDWIASGISLVVGLHFIPLGSIFDFPAYYFVGSLIAAWDILSVAALNSSNSTAFAALGTGVILWVTAIAMLFRSIRLARKLANA
jgi:hypothetical protein